MVKAAEQEKLEPIVNSELNEDAEFRGSKEDQEDLLLTAQRYLNIFHQIHIFKEAKRKEFDRQLLEMPQKVRQILAMLPGGRILLEHMEELEEQSGNRDAELLNLINQKSPAAETVSEAVAAVAPTVINAPVEFSSDFTKALTDSFSTYSQNLQQLNANIQQIAAQQQNIQAGGGAAAGIDIADTISALLKENSQQQMDVLKNFGQTLSQSIAASQKEFISTLLDKQSSSSPQVIDNKQQIEALKDFGKTLSQTIMESQKEFISTLLDKQTNSSPQVIDNKQQIEALKDFGKTLSQTIMESQKEFISTLLDKQRNIPYHPVEKVIEIQKIEPSIAPKERAQDEVPQVQNVVADKKDKQNMAAENKNKDDKPAKNKEIKETFEHKKEAEKEIKSEKPTAKENTPPQKTEALPEKDVAKTAPTPENTDKKDKKKNKNKNKDKNKDRKEEPINEAKTDKVEVIAPVIAQTEVPDILDTTAPLDIDIDSQITAEPEIENSNIIDDFGIDATDDITVPTLKQDQSDIDTPIDESVDIDLDEFFTTAKNNAAELQNTTSLDTDNIAPVDEPITPAEDILPASDETPLDEYVLDQPSDDFSSAFDMENEVEQPELAAKEENPKYEPEFEPEVTIEPEPEPAISAEPEKEPEIEDEDDVSSAPLASSRNADYDSAMLKIKEALNSTDAVSLDDMDITPVSLSSDNSFSSLTTEEYDDDLAQSFAELEEETPAPAAKTVADDEEWEYVDENGNPINPTDDEEWEYVDEDGNPVNPSADEEWEYVDENGNPVNPSGDEEWEYVDENGNPVDPSDGEWEYVDEDGNTVVS